MKSTCLIAATIFAIGFCVARPSVVRADGMMIGFPTWVRETKPVGTLTPEPRQEAFICRDGKKVRVVLRTHFQAGAPEVAWFIPVPSEPHDIAPAPKYFFAMLDEMTAPRFSTEIQMVGGGMGCGCAAPMGVVAGGAGHSTVRVEQAGVAGITEYKVLAADKADVLSDWLTTHGYAVPAGAAEAFAPYVQAGWHWLILRLRPDADAAGELAPQPIAYSYESDTLVYPMMISRQSAEPETEILLYVLGSTRYGCDNWTNATLNPWDVRVDPASPSYTTYEKIFHDMASAAPHLFITEYCDYIDNVDMPGLLAKVDIDAVPTRSPGAPGSRWQLTRMRALLTPQAMDRDVVLVPLTDYSPVYRDHDLSAQTAAGSPRGGNPPAASLALLGLIVTGSGLRKRPGLPRLAANCCLAAACLLIPML